MSPATRDYSEVLALAAAMPVLVPPVSDRARLGAMQRVTRLLWGAFANKPLSWIGFYQKAEADEMILVCREPKPACSPIGLHGMCGRGWRDQRPVVIPDIATLGAEYIACDPRDKSEVVVPVMNPDGTCWGVLDADSHELAAFTVEDALGMRAVLEASGLSAPSPAGVLTL